jgi:hypothetical protein
MKSKDLLRIILWDEPGSHIKCEMERGYRRTGRKITNKFIEKVEKNGTLFPRKKVRISVVLASPENNKQLERGDINAEDIQDIRRLKKLIEYTANELLEMNKTGARASIWPKT